MTTLVTEPRPHEENYEDDFATWETEALLNPPSRRRTERTSAPQRLPRTGITLFVPLEESDLS